jgi:hypothetical protein
MAEREARSTSRSRSVVAGPSCGMRRPRTIRSGTPRVVWAGADRRVWRPTRPRAAASAEAGKRRSATETGKTAEGRRGTYRWERTETDSWERRSWRRVKLGSGVSAGRGRSAQAGRLFDSR